MSRPVILCKHPWYALYCGCSYEHLQVLALLDPTSVSILSTTPTSEHSQEFFPMDWIIISADADTFTIIPTLANTSTSNVSMTRKQKNYILDYIISAVRQHFNPTNIDFPTVVVYPHPCLNTSLATFHMVHSPLLSTLPIIALWFQHLIMSA